MPPPPGARRLYDDLAPDGNDPERLHAGFNARPYTGGVDARGAW
jgi:hypothetical protein